MSQQRIARIWPQRLALALVATWVAAEQSPSAERAQESTEAVAAASTSADAAEIVAPAPGRRGRPDPSLPAASTEASPRFASLSAAATGVDFVNEIDLKHPRKRLYVSGFACGATALGDLNGDGQLDLLLTSGPRGNRLFVQTAPWKFRDVTTEAGVADAQHWSAGAALADVDDDGDLDIYVCRYDEPNALYLNDGTGRFQDVARQAGVAVVDASIMPSFCDYDRDGDLDLFVLTNKYERSGGRPAKPPIAFRNGRPYVLPEFAKYYGLIRRGAQQYNLDSVGRSDYLFRNNGDGTFTDVSRSAGIVLPGHGLSATWWDANGDLWPDLYVANDFDDYDRWYRNNGDGTFTDVLSDSVPYSSWFSMGSDFGDVDGDGRFDLLVADMAPSTHAGRQTTMAAMSPEKLSRVAGPPQQTMQNTLLLNGGGPRFAEAADAAGLSRSDWTWAVKLADFDNDGRLDVAFTNGVSRNFNNADMPLEPQQLVGRTEWELYERLPARAERNLLFRNLGDLQFAEVGAEWGFDHVGMSYACASGDVDGDGDVDLVVANLGEPVHLLRNDSRGANWLQLRLRGTSSNRQGIGARITLVAGENRQVRMLSPQTGFLSSNDPTVCFGLGPATAVDQLIVEWPSGARQEQTQVAVNQRLEVVEPAAEGDLQRPAPRDAWPAGLFRANPPLPETRHREAQFDDFSVQPLLPRRLSRLGPGLALSDIDGDGDLDAFLGGAAGASGTLLVNRGEGRLAAVPAAALLADGGSEDLGAVWFDADGDGDDDLYVASGGVEAPPGHPTYQDRLYLNDGQGGLTRAPTDRLPAFRDSSGPVAAADFDRDGDLDLFIGTRVVPGEYPRSGPSRLLENRDGVFHDVASARAPDLVEAGMVTAALWSDYDDDGWLDLWVATDWGPVRLFRNDQGTLREVTQQVGLASHTGWWNGLASGDFDGDGDIDYVASNFGTGCGRTATFEQPCELWQVASDDVGEARLWEAQLSGEALVPWRSLRAVQRAWPELARRFPTHAAYSRASLSELLPQAELQAATRSAVTCLASGVWLNEGAGGFRFLPLPARAQLAPAFGMAVADVDGDGRLDLLVAQNSPSAPPDARPWNNGLSLLLRGRGDGSFVAATPAESGVRLPGYATAAVIADVDQDGLPDALVAMNDGPLELLSGAADEPEGAGQGRGAWRICLEGSAKNRRAIGARLRLVCEEGATRVAEVHAGSGYLSQGPTEVWASLPLGAAVSRIEVRWPDGSQTSHLPDASTSIRIIYPPSPGT